jgi:hypothetical protein
MTANVTAVAASRAVQLSLRPIHHSIAQHITTGTMISGRTGVGPPLVARGAAAADINTDGAADFHAGIGARDLREARAIFRAGTARTSTLDGRLLARRRDVIQLQAASRIGLRRRGRPSCNEQEEKDGSHDSCVARAARFGHPKRKAGVFSVRVQFANRTPACLRASRNALISLESQDYFETGNNPPYPQKLAVPDLPSRGKPTIRCRAVALTAMA